jgi:hypothetical protein
LQKLIFFIATDFSIQRQVTFLSSQPSPRHFLPHFASVKMPIIIFHVIYASPVVLYTNLGDLPSPQSNEILPVDSFVPLGNGREDEIYNEINCQASE